MRASSPTLPLVVFSLFNVAATASACKSNEWVNLAPIPTPRQEHGAVAINNETIAILGGIVVAGSGTEMTDLLQFYDIPTGTRSTKSAVLHKSDTWSDLAPMPNGEKGSSIVGVHGEMIYLAGGMAVLQDTYQDTNTVVSFNMTSGLWQRVVANAAELPESRHHGWYGRGDRRYLLRLQLTCLFPAVGSKFYVFGGEGNPDTVTGVFDQSEAFDTEAQEWTELKPMAVPRHGTQAASVGGLVYIPGGGLQQDGKAVSVNGGLGGEVYLRFNALDTHGEETSSEAIQHQNV
ncbi:kelch repeat-containing protein [Fusarium phyllophilum]|uniref:Kelch repeat-containing protein n=1 Tax=Fusarium phyllophilum TaxID=47803 RepID=A0A8H5JPL9_9HYPO|nr:kelch repeat-containing protein [Fusarium phyllophilum]